MQLNKTMSEHENNPTPEEPPEGPPEGGFYVVDDETQELLEAAVALIGSLINAQVNDEARNNLRTIADEIAVRFGMDSFDVEEVEYDGEYMLRPLGGVIPDPESEGSTAEN